MICRGRIGVALLAVLVLAFFAGCEAEVDVGQERTLDSADLEQQLADELAPQAGVKPADVDVACPDGQKVKAGSEFHCSLTTPDGDEVRVDITLTDDEGGFTARVPKE